VASSLPAKGKSLMGPELQATSPESSQPYRRNFAIGPELRSGGVQAQAKKSAARGDAVDSLHFAHILRGLSGSQKALAA